MTNTDWPFQSRPTLTDKIAQSDPIQSCCCIGPQDGAPLCPCQMRSQCITQRDGRWIRPERDLGPVK